MMRTYLITGGTDGIGKGIAMHLLEKGEQVIVVGSSLKKGELMLSEARQLGAANRVKYIQADLSLVTK